jgi:transposase-like protein
MLRRKDSVGHGKKINDDVLNALLKGCEGSEDLLGEGSVMRGLKRALMQRMLGAELTEHLGNEHGEEAPPVQTNRRNGVSRTTVKSEVRRTHPVSTAAQGVRILTA